VPEPARVVMWMNVLLIDVDSKMPNLALMKLSAWHKERGDRVYFNNGCQDPDKVYISCVFSKNAPRARGTTKMFSCPVEIGGYGVNGAKLPDEIEHIMPDYDLYEFTRKEKVAIGYTQRGCNNLCPWCVVPQKEGRNHDHAPITEFLPEDFNKVILLDPNILDSPKCRENLQFTIDNDLNVNFSQGIDARLVNEENAAMLADINCQNWHFTTRRLHTAWDRLEDEKKVRRGIQRLKDAGIKDYTIMCYFICAYGIRAEDYTLEYFLSHDMYRFEVLRELGVDPYAMVYNDRKDIPVLRHFDRWVNGRVYKVCEWEDYDHSDSQTIIKNAGGMVIR